MELTDQRRKQLIKYFSDKIKAAHLEVPMIILLGTCKSLSFLCSQTMIFFQPFAMPFFGQKRTDDFISFLGERDNWEQIIRVIERPTPKRTVKEG